MREETKHAEAIVEGHDHGPLSRQVLTVVPGKAAGAAGETAAVDPDHHRTAVIGVVRAGPDVSVEAVFTAGGLARRSCEGGAKRRTRGCRTSAAAARRSGRTGDTGGSERVRLAHSVPLRSRLWRAPPVVAERRRRERDPLEDAHARLTCAYRACNQARFDPCLFRNPRGGVRDGRDKRCGGEETFNSLHVFSLLQYRATIPVGGVRDRQL